MALLKNPMFWIGMIALFFLVIILYKLSVFDGIIGWFENVFDLGGTGAEGTGGTVTGGETAGDTTQTE